MIIAVDFDGTIVEHDYPRIGKPVPHAIRYLKKFNNLGAQLILWTMRDGETLNESVDYCQKNGVNFWAINQNPQQREWTWSPKVYTNLYIDDAAFGCPLVTPVTGRPFVDWQAVGPTIVRMLQK